MLPATPGLHGDSLDRFGIFFPEHLPGGIPGVAGIDIDNQDPRSSAGCITCPHGPVGGRPALVPFIDLRVNLL